MKLKISLLFIVVVACLPYAGAQTACNPLNFEPARVPILKGLSSWKLSEEIYYRADDTPFEKRSYQYDENERQTAELTFRFEKDDRTWRQTVKSEYQYDEGKKIVMELSGQQWTSKTEIMADVDGKPCLSFAYAWNRYADDWSVNPYLKTEWTYNEQGQVTTCLKLHKNPTTNEWYEFDIRISYDYDSDGALREELFQSWNNEQRQWINKGSYRYSTINKLQKEAVSSFFVNDNRVFDGKTVYFYDEEGKIARCEYYKYNTDKVLNAYSINTYTEMASQPETLESPEITVFPNPVVSSFTLTVPKEFVGKTMYLFDAWGKQAKMLPVADQTTQIDVANLTRGVYLLKIGELSNKIVLK